MHNFDVWLMWRIYFDVWFMWRIYFDVWFMVDIASSNFNVRLMRQDACSTSPPRYPWTGVYSGITRLEPWLRTHRKPRSENVSSWIIVRINMYVCVSHTYIHTYIHNIHTNLNTCSRICLVQEFTAHVIHVMYEHVWKHLCIPVLSCESAFQTWRHCVHCWYIFLCMTLWLCVCMCRFVCVYMQMHVHMYVCMYVCIHIYIYMYVLCMYMFVFVYKCMYIYIYIYI
jgi:hypothetical protein